MLATLKRFQLLFIWVILDSKGHCLRFAAPNSLGHDKLKQHNTFGIKKITSYHPNSVYIRSCLLCTFTGECHFYKKNVLSMLSIIFKSIISILNVFFNKDSHCVIYFLSFAIV